MKIRREQQKSYIHREQRKSTTRREQSSTSSEKDFWREIMAVGRTFIASA